MKSRTNKRLMGSIVAWCVLWIGGGTVLLALWIGGVEPSLVWKMARGWFAGCIVSLGLGIAIMLAHSYLKDGWAKSEEEPREGTFVHPHQGPPEAHDPPRPSAPPVPPGTLPPPKPGRRSG